MQTIPNRYKKIKPLIITRRSRDGTRTTTTQLALIVESDKNGQKIKTHAILARRLSSQQ